MGLLLILKNVILSGKNISVCALRLKVKIATTGSVSQGLLFVASGHYAEKGWLDPKASTWMRWGHISTSPRIVGVWWQLFSRASGKRACC